MEVWKTIIGHEDYKVSNFGRVKSFKKGKEIILKPSNGKRGYNLVVLDKKTMSIHRLVALTFIPNVDNKLCVNHIDGNKHNNNILNLEWCSYSENIKHAFDNKIRIDVSINHWNCKLSKKDIIDIKYLIDNKEKTQKEISKIYKVNQSTISDIKNGKKRKYE
jgi:hypothetical protein